MTLSELRYVVAVARELHFGRAAERCFVSQPTLSVAVKKIEEELSISIFERYQHDISVTPIGKQIIKQAELILNEANNLKEIAKQNQDQLIGELKLGVIYTVGPYLLPKLIPLINQTATDLILLIEEDYTHNLGPKLKSGEIDVAILANPFEESGIVTEVLYKEPFKVALPARHALAKKKKLKATDLLDDVILLLKSGNCFRDQIVELFPKHSNSITGNNNIQKSLESSSIETIKQMVVAGAGITIVPSLSTEASDGLSSLLEYRTFSDPIPYREVIIAYRKSFPRKKAIDLIKSQIASFSSKQIF